MEIDRERLYYALKDCFDENPTGRSMILKQ